MGQTLIEKIISAHSGKTVKSGDIVDVSIDARCARDFGGANVVKNLKQNALCIHDTSKTFFTFDCNPCGSDQQYATNQQLCRQYARETGIKIFDIDSGVGTHLAIDQRLVLPGGTLVSTDSHANILGAIGAFGQGMGDAEIAHVFAYGHVWFKVPPTIRVILKGTPGPHATPKDIGLALLAHFGANGLLGVAAELSGQVLEGMSLDGRITLASLATEMGGIITFIPPDEALLRWFDIPVTELHHYHPDSDARYDQVVEVDINGLDALISRPGHPEDVVDIRAVEGRKIDSVFIGSCTNGRMDDLRLAARILSDKRVAPGVVLKIVPTTDLLWQQCLKEGLLETFKQAGALVGNAGCAGCAAGQIGQNGPGEITISTGNRNFAGKQGKGEVYLASPAVAAASAIAGMIVHPDRIPECPAVYASPKYTAQASKGTIATGAGVKPATITGRVWVIQKDNIDTDMIYHNRHLTVTDIHEMGQHTFGNLDGWMDFSKNAQKGDIVITGANFGCGSSRQQAVDCFKSLGISLIIGSSFGSIYERNAINAGFPILTADTAALSVKNGDTVSVNLATGEISVNGSCLRVTCLPFSDVQMAIYQKGGLLVSELVPA